VSATQIFVAVPVINLAGDVANSAFGVRPNVAGTAQAVAAGINSQGGVACRKLVIKTYQVNPLDPNDQHAKCLQIIADKPFAVIDIGGYVDPVGRACFVQAKLPYNGVALMNADELNGAYPYLFTPTTETDRSERNWVYEAAAHGAFDPNRGFRKLGITLDQCNLKANAALMSDLAKVGVPSDKTSTFTRSGCAGLATPSEISQALAQHRGANVSHVFLSFGAANSQSYVQQADGLGWKPTYLTSDYQQETNPTLAPRWSDGFDGAVAITSARFGERNSGVANPLVDQCNDWMKKANVAPSPNEEDVIPGELCDEFRLFAAAANAAGPNLVRTALVGAGLGKVSRFNSAILGDGIFDRSGKLAGGDFVRAIQWHLDCKCWKIIDPAVKPGH
jgi:hypothetical protein